ncbi:MAG: hypothetical protein ACRD4U_09665 [Candidatus Acidiferrales bacterium]
MALVAIKTSTGTGYCDCIHGCYELASLRDDETDRGYCYRCAEEHLERNREVVKRIPRPQPPGSNLTLPPGAKPPALQHSA